MNNLIDAKLIDIIVITNFAKISGNALFHFSTDDPLIFCMILNGYIIVCVGALYFYNKILTHEP